MKFAYVMVILTIGCYSCEELKTTNFTFFLQTPSGNFATWGGKLAEFGYQSITLEKTKCQQFIVPNSTFLSPADKSILNEVQKVRSSIPGPIIEVTAFSDKFKPALEPLGFTKRYYLEKYVVRANREGFVVEGDLSGLETELDQIYVFGDQTVQVVRSDQVKAIDESCYIQGFREYIRRVADVIVKYPPPTTQRPSTTVTTAKPGDSTTLATTTISDNGTSTTTTFSPSPTFKTTVNPGNRTTPVTTASPSTTVSTTSRPSDGTTFETTVKPVNGTTPVTTIGPDDGSGTEGIDEANEDGTANRPNFGIIRRIQMKKLYKRTCKRCPRSIDEEQVELASEEKDERKGAEFIGKDPDKKNENKNGAKGHGKDNKDDGKKDDKDQVQKKEKPDPSQTFDDAMLSLQGQFRIDINKLRAKLQKDLKGGNRREAFIRYRIGIRDATRRFKFEAKNISRFYEEKSMTSKPHQP